MSCHKGPPCPDGMASILGQCLGLVKNSAKMDTALDTNCNWKSGDPNYQLAALYNDKVTWLSLEKSQCHF